MTWSSSVTYWYLTSFSIILYKFISKFILWFPLESAYFFFFFLETFTTTSPGTEVTDWFLVVTLSNCWNNSITFPLFFGLSPILTVPFFVGLQRNFTLIQTDYCSNTLGHARWYTLFALWPFTLSPSKGEKKPQFCSSILKTARQLNSTSKKRKIHSCHHY